MMKETRDTQTGIGKQKSRFKFGRWGLEENPVGHFVKLIHAGRMLLGEVIAFERNEVLNCTLLTVRHFNGQEWPIKPGVLAVEVIRQEAR